TTSNDKLTLIIPSLDSGLSPHGRSYELWFLNNDCLQSITQCTCHGKPVPEYGHDTDSKTPLFLFRSSAIAGDFPFIDLSGRIAGVCP
ncbi:hypothetical protein, partial [Pseudomonas aeruginosa]|uniref:hypothetical protein n=1 Tax=Pseudomonas aeruginosa TaxID=287 RepID=UPI001968C658